jgi:hypothetical protein
MHIPDTGNGKLRKPVRLTPDIPRRQLTIILQITKTQTTTPETQTTTPATQTTRNLMGNPTTYQQNQKDLVFPYKVLIMPYNTR